MALARGHSGHMMHDKGIDGIGHDGDIIDRLLAGPMEPKVLDTANKKGPARAFLVQLAHSPETRWVILMPQGAPCRMIPCIRAARPPGHDVDNGRCCVAITGRRWASTSETFAAWRGATVRSLPS